MLLAVLFAGGCNAHARKVNGDPTGICYRRLVGKDASNHMVSRYEVIIFSPSSSLSKDIERVNMLSVKGSAIMNPEIYTSSWIYALVSDTEFTNNTNKKCTGLPIISERR